MSVLEPTSTLLCPYFLSDSDPPSPLRALQIGSQLMANACKLLSPFPASTPTSNFVSPVIVASAPIRWCESNDPGVAAGMTALRLPRIFVRLYAWFYRYVLRDPVYATLVEGWHVQDGQAFYALVGQREEYRSQWFEYWQGAKLDFVLCVPNALPAMRHGDSARQWKSCGYTFLFNIVGIEPRPFFFFFSSYGTVLENLMSELLAAGLFGGRHAHYACGSHARQTLARVQASEQD